MTSRFEFVDYYPIKDWVNKKHSVIGTVHVYLLEMKIDLRGILVTHKGKIRYHMPQGKALDKETGKKVTFPYINFLDVTIFPDLMQFLQDKVTPLIEAYLKAAPPENRIPQKIEKKKFFPKKPFQKKPFVKYKPVETAYRPNQTRK